MNYDFRRAIIVSHWINYFNGGKGWRGRWCKNIDVIFKKTKKKRVTFYCS